MDKKIEEEKIKELAKLRKREKELLAELGLDKETLERQEYEEWMKKMDALEEEADYK